MPRIDHGPMTQSTVLRIYSEKDDIMVSPAYQRNGDIWPIEKRQLLIDSIINNYDIPKIYFHKLSTKEREATGKQYSIIDGRQRLETIWGFINGDFQTADKFKYLKDPKIDISGYTYADLAKDHPKIKINFDSTSLPVILIETDDLELIEDMFSRLNEAVPLNAAEKRNAFGGVMARLITKISNHRFFKEKVNFSNKRYQHKEIAAKLLFLTYNLKNNISIVDTKKIYLDHFVKEFKHKREADVASLEKEVVSILNEMVKLFLKNDPLLTAQGTLPTYYLLIRDYKNNGKLQKFSRNLLMSFRTRLEKNRIKAEKDIGTAEFDLLEYDRMSQQGTNDASSIKSRVDVLKKYLKV